MPEPESIPVHLVVNGAPVDLLVDTRTTLLDLLREHLDLTGSKKGCDHGQCGSCTVLVDNRRINSCLQLAVAVDGTEVLTIEGLAGPSGLHPMQQAFLDHDAYQCGYCTPGQICSAIGMLDEFAAGWPSAVTGAEPFLDAAELGPAEQGPAELGAGRLDAARLDAAEIRERMSGNLCRCGAYVNLVPAIMEASLGASR